MRYLLAILACTGVLACAGNEPKKEPRFIPASREVAPDEHNGVCFAAMSSARCDHDQSCGYIDPGKRYVDRDACLNFYNSAGYKSLENCATPIDRNQLRQCLASIKSADCDSAMVDIGTLDACNYGSLCRAMP